MTDGARILRASTSRRLAVALLAASTLATGCRHLPPPLRARAVADCPGPLLATEEIDGDFLVRQRVRVTARDESWSLQLVAQKRGDELTLLGFHPLGAKLFSLQQRGDRTRVDAAPAPLLEIPPRNLLRDFHRERLLTVPRAGTDGTFLERWGSVEIRELRVAGRVIERRFQPAGGERAAVTLYFAAAEGRDTSHVRIANDRCGYHAEITTLTEEHSP
jgi:hypothetical protein